jgi:hypothetical protein
MPEPITIVQEATPALSPENREMLQSLEQEQQGEQPQLLAGKYKSVDDLEKAYKELQTKLSQGRAEEPAEEPGEEPAEESDEAEEEQPAGNARETYGDLIGGRLEEAGVDFKSMSDRFSQAGKLDDGDYDQLAQAGFSREMVDAYLTGLNYQITKDSQLATQEVAAIKQQYGGDAGYAAMIEWASSNLPKGEVDAFNKVINSQPLDVVKLAVAGLHAKYSESVGREPKLVSGRAPKSSGEKYESTAQVVAAMSDPRYQSDPAYRRKVEERLARSSIM